MSKKTDNLLYEAIERELEDWKKIHTRGCSHLSDARSYIAGISKAEEILRKWLVDEEA